MVRPNDEFWKCFERMDNRLLKCKYCEQVLSGSTSISRIKLHLSGLSGRGVKECPTVPDDIRKRAHDASVRADDAAHDKRQKTRSTDASTSKGGMPQQVQATTGFPDAPESGGGAEVQAILTSYRTSISTSSCAPSETERTQLEACPSWSPGHDTTFEDDMDLSGEDVQDLIQSLMGSLGEDAAFLRNLCGPELPQFDGEVQIPGGLTQEAYEELRTLLKSQLSEMIRDIGTEIVMREELMPDADRSSTLEEQMHVLQIQESLRPAQGVPLLRRKLVGRALEEGVHLIWSWLMNNEISSIGVYGVGGVGKTTLVTQINNQLQRRPNIFRHVYWVRIGQGFSISRVQDLIAEAFSFDLSQEKDERKRAATLYKQLVMEKQYVLILDDLWDHLTVEEVGVPAAGDGCKLIITTRSFELCKKLPCQEIMEVKPLPMEETWRLFNETLGNAAELHHDVWKIAKHVANECDGLPLGIITLAGSMRGVDHIPEWQCALEKLKESKVRYGDDLGPKVFSMLKLCYDRLTDPKLQECFLCCALYPEDFEIPREELIEYMIEERIVEGKSRWEETNEGHSMINKLVNICLLEPVTTTKYEYIKMHDLIRDMALQELRKKQEVIVEYGELSSLQDKEKWTGDLSIVSMMGSGLITEIPFNLSPNSPNLSTLLLCNNERLRWVEDAFFVQLHGLKVLHLSNTRIKRLPDSIADLVNLNALILKRCKHLKHVPSLWKLTSLRKLDLSDTELKKLPKGVKYLSELRYMNLDRAKKLAKFPDGILPNLIHLQVLKLPLPSSLTPFLRDYNMKKLIRSSEVIGLKKLEVLQCGIYYEDEVSHRSCRAALKALRQCRVAMVPGNKMVVGLQHLMILEFWKWNRADEGIHAREDTICEDLILDEKIEKLDVFNIGKFQVLNCITFSNLNVIEVNFCDGMKKLFPPSLGDLEVLVVGCSGKIEEIVKVEKKKKKKKKNKGEEEGEEEKNKKSKKNKKNKKKKKKEKEKEEENGGDHWAGIIPNLKSYINATK